MVKPTSAAVSMIQASSSVAAIEPQNLAGGKRGKPKRRSRMRRP